AHPVAEPAGRACLDHGAVGDRVDRRAERVGDVDAAVLLAATRTELRRQPTLGGLDEFGGRGSLASLGPLLPSALLGALLDQSGLTSLFPRLLLGAFLGLLALLDPLQVCLLGLELFP